MSVAFTSLLREQRSKPYLQLVREFSALFEKLVEMLRRLGKQLGIFEVCTIDSEIKTSALYVRYYLVM